jgi:hypothetical protein
MHMLLTLASQTWEGGVRGVGFVRGTNSAVAQVKSGMSSVQLMHSTDWLPTLAHLANLGSDKPRIALVSEPAAADGSEAGSAMLRPGGKTVLRAVAGGIMTLPLDGYDQWQSIASGGVIDTSREILAHNVPAKAQAVLLNASSHSYGTSTCIDAVDADGRLMPSACHGFGIVGGAIRKGHHKLMWVFSNQTQGAPRGISSNVPPGVPQYLPGGMVHRPANLTTPVGVRNASLYLFDIVKVRMPNRSDR